MVPAAELMMPGNFEAEMPPPSVEEMPLESLPIRPSVSNLTFGLKGEQAPVGTEISEHVELKNVGERKQTFTFYPPASCKFKLSVEPKTGAIRRGSTAAVDIKMTFLCTTKLRENIRFTTQEYSKKGKSEKVDRILMGVLRIEMDSKLSTRIDYDELKLYTPPIGEGSFGTVYKGDWRGAEVAVKVLKSSLLDQDESVLTEFMREMDIMRGLRCEFIVGFFGAVLVPGRLSLVTEFCQMGSLNSLLRKQPNISVLLKLRFVIDAARGMYFLHQNGILHRDLKSDNLLVVSTNPRAPVVCKLTDFGTSRTMSSKAREEMTTGLGTPIYMAPEILNRQPYSVGADVYSFAILLLEVYTQKVPYNSPEFLRSWAITKFVSDGKRLPIPDDCPLPYGNVILSCWAQNPLERPAFDRILRELNEFHSSTVKQHRADVKLRRFQRREKGEDVSSDSDSEEEVTEATYRIRGLSVLQTAPAPGAAATSGETKAKTQV